MPLSDELARAAEAAGRFAAAKEEVSAVIPTEPEPGTRVYLCAFETGDRRSWLALDSAGQPIRSRVRVRDAVTIAAMCELAEEAAGREAFETPRVASPAYLDRVGSDGGPELATTLRHGVGTVEELVREVDALYKLELE